MGYIEQAFKGFTDWWRYLLGLVFIFIIWQLGSTIQLMFVALELYNQGLSGEQITEKIGDVNVLLGTLEPNFNFFLLMLGFVIGFIGLLFTIKFFHHLKFKYLVTSRNKIDWKRVLLSFSIVATLSVSSILVAVELSPEEYVFNLEWKRFLILLVISLLMVPIQTTFEELYFRGYLMQALGTIFKKRSVALILTSLLFGGLHFFNPEVAKIGNLVMVSYIGTGLLLGILTLMDDGLELAIGFHAANNMMIGLFVTADWTAFNTHSIYKYVGEPSVNADVLIPVLVVYPILIITFAIIYKWKNWRSKLFGNVNLVSAEDT